MTDYFSLLEKEVIKKGSCTHCGTCVGLCPSQLTQKETIHGPIPIRKGKKEITNKLIYDSCPARSIQYKELHKFVFGKRQKDFLLGTFDKGYVGYAKDSFVRTNGASGGVTTAILIYLLEEKLIDGAVVLKQGTPKPWLAKPIIATTKEEILACSQSVYVPTMTNAILSEIESFQGNLAFIGLPDQVAMIRKLQLHNHPAAQKIKYIIGPYVGTGIYAESIASFLRSNKVKDGLSSIKSMKYREGEWPGYLRVTTKKGEEFRSSKFYYNYLIPFYVTRPSLTTIDFSNELTDISIGDAWHPKYESIGKGFSVILPRTEKGKEIIKNMQEKNIIDLEVKNYSTLFNMHAHMIDFKKRGAFIRMKWMKFFGAHVPNYDYKPKKIPLSRYIPELIISGSFVLGRTKFCRWLIEQLPMTFVGNSFNTLRKKWKSISKSTKRKGIRTTEFAYK